MNFKEESLVLLNNKEYILKIIKNIVTGAYEFYLYTKDGDMYTNEFNLNDLVILNEKSENYIVKSVGDLESASKISLAFGDVNDTESLIEECENIFNTVKNSFDLTKKTSNNLLSLNDVMYINNYSSYLKELKNEEEDLFERLKKIKDKSKSINILNINIKDLIYAYERIETKKKLLKSKEEYFDLVLNKEDNNQKIKDEIKSLKEDITYLNASVQSLKKMIEEESNKLLSR